MIGLEESSSRQRDCPVLPLNQLFVVEPFIYRLELVPDIHAKLAAKILDVNSAGLELQDHLANQFLFGSQRQRPQQWQLILLEQGQVLLKTMSILAMDATQIRE